MLIFAMESFIWKNQNFACFAIELVFLTTDWLESLIHYMPSTAFLHRPYFYKDTQTIYYENRIQTVIWYVVYGV